MPLVSVIIPVRDRAVLVEAAIASALAQSCRDLEVLVGDDGSRDGTLQVLERAAGRDPRVRILTWRPGAGVAMARNRLLAAADCRFIGLLDSDDLWTPDKLERQLALLATLPQCGVCHTLERWQRGDTQIIPPARLLRTTEDPFLANLARCTVSPSASLLRRELFASYGDFDEALPACEDQDLWLRLARHTGFACLPAGLTIRRGGRGDQLSERLRPLDRFRIICLLKQLDAELPPHYRRPLLHALEEKARIMATGSRKREKDRQAVLFEKLAGWAAAAASE